MSGEQPQPAPNQSEGGYPQQPFSAFAEHVQRHYADLVTYGQPAHNRPPAEDMTEMLARTGNDASFRDNTTIQDAAHNIKWAFIALTYPNYSPRYQTEYIRQYNQLQREQQEQGGNTDSIEVHGEQTKLLGWMLDQIGVAHDFQEGDITVPFAPMEAKMQQIAQTQGSYSHDTRLRDHETKARVHGLMDELKEMQEGNEQS
jgi:hypothetical protein